LRPQFPHPSRLGFVSPLLFVSILLVSQAVSAQSGPDTPSRPEQRLARQMAAHTTVKVLPNGLTLIISERHEAPVFSFFTLVDAGSADDPGGQSGLAHMFEHIAFKGTTEIGTPNYAAEQQALAAVETAYAAFDAESRKRPGSDDPPNPDRLALLHKAFDDAVARAQTYVVPNEFSEIAERNGAVGLNAETSEDQTEYFWSMPSNRLELWAYLESSRIGFPVAREFYKERDVVQEERRMRVDSNPEGRLIEEFLPAAYMAHPYGTPGVGWESDISQVTATEAQAFHARFYKPANIVIALVGDIDTAAAMPMLETYFGRIPATGPKPLPVLTREPPQTAERSVTLHETTQPIYIEGYHKPSYLSPDDSVYDAIADIFSNGRTSRLYRALVRDQQIAAAAEGFTGLPGVKYPSLFAFYAVPNEGHTNDELRTSIHKQIEVLKTSDVTDAELERFKTSARAGLLRGLDDNAGLAGTLATYQTRYGDWQQMFRELAKIDAVSKADIRRVANQIFTESNRTSARIDFQPPTASPAQAGQGGAQ